MNDLLKSRLTELGVTDEQVTAIEALGAVEVGDMNFVLDTDLVGVGIKPIVARKVVAAFKPVIATPTHAPGLNPLEQEIPEGVHPSTSQVNAFAGQFGMDPSFVNTILVGNMMSGSTGMPLDFTSLIPIAQILPGYSPKKRDMAYIFMGQVEKQLVDREKGEGIIVINPDGSVNHTYTAKHVENLDVLNFNYPDDGFFYDDAGNPYEIVQVGVDAQNYYDADPLDIDRPMAANMRGIGGVRYKGTSLDVRQVIRLAVVVGEINHDNRENKLSWLRNNVTAATTRTDLTLEFPRAVAKWNELSRANDLPTLRVMNNRKPRREEIAPRRRTRPDRGSHKEGLPGTGSGFPFDDDER
jgi:hypothetical protein